MGARNDVLFYNTGIYSALYYCSLGQISVHPHCAAGLWISVSAEVLDLMGFNGNNEINPAPTPPPQGFFAKTGLRRVEKRLSTL